MCKLIAECVGTENVFLHSVRPHTKQVICFRSPVGYRKQNGKKIQRIQYEYNSCTISAAHIIICHSLRQGYTLLPSSHIKLFVSYEQYITVTQSLSHDLICQHVVAHCLDNLYLVLHQCNKRKCMCLIICEITAE